MPPADTYGVASFYALLALEERPAEVLHVCTDLACALAGAEVPEGAHPSPCLGLCERAPASLRTVAGEAPREIQLPETGPPLPQAGEDGLRLLRRIGAGLDPTSLDDYRAHGGYASLDAARSSSAPTGVRREVSASKLLGRGGAAFPTGAKWEAVARQDASPHYLVCNADESEPGTFKDRVLMESDPFALVEAMTIAALRDRLRARASSTSAPSTRSPTSGSRARSPRRAPAGLLGRRRGRRRLRVRRRAADRRGRLRLRRGDRALPVDRGLPRRAAQQAAVPGRGRASSASRRS